ncbi:MAG: hypothetical protein EOM55_01740 [Clostridia bacterium]|nr:hypothetical protein [Clostridia bacterium]
MKKFWKNNLYTLILVFAGIICLFLGTFFVILLPIGMLILAVPMLLLAIRCKKKYDKMKTVDENKDIFDATKLDYDEEVYYVGKTSQKKEHIKGVFSKFNAINPVIIFGFLSVAFVIMAIMGFLNINY